MKNKLANPVVAIVIGLLIILLGSLISIYLLSSIYYLLFDLLSPINFIYSLFMIIISLSFSLIAGIIIGKNVNSHGIFYAFFTGLLWPFFSFIFFLFADLLFSTGITVGYIINSTLPVIIFTSLGGYLGDRLKKR